MVLRIFRVGSLLLAIAGLVVLLLIAGHSQAPAVQVGRLAGTMNWAYVGMEGVVSRQPSYDAVDDSLQFWLWDGTGEILVLAPKSAAEMLLSARLVPVMGDRVTLEGTLRVRDDFPYLFLNDPQSIQLQPSLPLAVTVAGAAAQPLYQKVAVRGVVRAIRKPYDGLWILAVRDATGEISVALSDESMTLEGGGLQANDRGGTGLIPDRLVGQSVQLVAGVDRYKGEPQLSVGRASDLVVLDEALVLVTLKQIGELAEHDVGSLVLVEGVVSEVAPFSAGVKYTIDDGSGTAVMLLWQDLAPADRNSLIPGAMVRVQGELAEYQGQLEVIPQVPSDVIVLAGIKPSVASPLPEEQPRSVLEPRGGEEPGDPSDGSVRLAEPTRGPALTSLAATSTAIPTVGIGPESNASGTLAPTVEAGPDSVTGEQSPEGTAMPQEPMAKPSPRATGVPASTWPLGSIAGGEVGKVLTTQARIVDLSFFSKGIKATLDDGSGRIILLLWQNVVEEISDRYDLMPGSQLRVSGEVVDYEGQMEIIPHKGEQVVVLARGQRLPIEERTLKDITPADEGRIFSVEGKVVRIEQGAWLRLLLRDNTGEILVFVPERTVEYLPHGVGEGMQLRVTGVVDIYKGELEIIPLAGADVEVR